MAQAGRVRRVGSSGQLVGGWTPGEAVVLGVHPAQLRNHMLRGWTVRSPTRSSSLTRANIILFNRFAHSAGPGRSSSVPAVGCFGDGFGLVLGSFWGHFGVILGSVWDHFGVILGSFWDHFGVILG